MMDNTVADGRVVSIAYALSVDGDTIDEAPTTDPVDYLHGALNIVPGLEAALTGRQVGDRLTVTVPPEQGYGDYEADDVAWFYRDELDDVEAIAPGMVLVVEDDDGEL